MIVPFYPSRVWSGTVSRLNGQDKAREVHMIADAGATVGLEPKLCQAADALRGSMGAAEVQGRALSPRRCELCSRLHKGGWGR